jgi:hypothetical protein
MSERNYIIRHGKRIAIETLDTGITPPTRISKPRFVKLPLLWIERLDKIKASGSTYRLAVHILRKAWQRRASTVIIPNIPQVSRNGRRTGLRVLARVGLISVKLRSSKSPIVTVLHVD